MDLGNQAKKRSTKLSQDEEVGMKWKIEALVPLQPVLHLLSLVRRIVVDD